MSEFKVESGIPMPAPNKRTHRKTKYPWRQMKIGQSFFVPNVKSGAMAGRCSNAFRYGFGKFQTRTVKGGCRVWRVK